MSAHRHLYLAVFLALFAAVAALQWSSGAMSADYGGAADEPAHYVTGLMVHDYIAAGAPWPPMSFARDYYLHYPKVGIGHWPPFFYLLQAAWMGAFGVSRVSLMLLMAALSALLGTTLFRAAQREFGIAAGLAVSLVFLSMPRTAAAGMMVMAEIPLSALVLLGLLAYARYLDDPCWRSAAWFGLWSALAILTKGTGVVLALLPPLALLLTWRWNLLRRFSFWLPPLIVSALAGPWYALAPGALHTKVAKYGGVVYMPAKAWTTPSEWVGFLGLLPTLAAIAGIVIAGRWIYRRQASGLWVSCAALLLGTLIFRQWVAAWEARHLITGVPALLLLAVLGVRALTGRAVLAGLPRHITAAAAGAVIIALLVRNLSLIPRKQPPSFSGVAKTLLADKSLQGAVLLVCSGGEGEGVFVAEVAMRETRPGHIVLRGSQLLSSSDWMGQTYRARFHTPEESLAAVEVIPAAVVVIDGEGVATPHGRMLLDGLRRYPERWRRVALPARNGAARVIHAFRLAGYENRAPGSIRLPADLLRSLP